MLFVTNNKDTFVSSYLDVKSAVLKFSHLCLKTWNCSYLWKDLNCVGCTLARLQRG